MRTHLLNAKHLKPVLVLTLAALLAVVAPQPARGTSVHVAGEHRGRGGEARTERVSISSEGAQADDASRGAVVSDDGRWVAFASFATNLVPGDGNGPGDAGEDIFVRDAENGTTVRVSVATDGREAVGHSHFPSISGDGFHVAFQAHDALVPGVPNGPYKVYVRDRDVDRDAIADEAGAVATVYVSERSDGVAPIGNVTAPALTRAGRFVTFRSETAPLVGEDANGVADYYVRDRDTDGDGALDEPGDSAIALVSSTPAGAAGNAGSGFLFEPAPPSSSGRFVAFASEASDLVAVDANGASDVFVRDRDPDADGVFDEPGAGVTERVSVGPLGIEANDESDQPAISADGRFVAFRSTASNLAPGDVNGVPDVFVHDRQTHQTVLVSALTFGEPIFGGSAAPDLSADGRFVTFESTTVGPFASLVLCPSLLLPVGPCSSVLVHDRDADADGIFDELGATSTEVASVSPAGIPGDGSSRHPSISAEGLHVAFESLATNLVDDDGNGVQDAFLRTR